MMILALAYDAWSEAFILDGAYWFASQLIKSSYEDYTEHFSVGLRRKASPKPPKYYT
jgi:hypothetical protein